MRDKGGEGSKNPKKLRDVVYGWSLCIIVVPIVEALEVALEVGVEFGTARFEEAPRELVLVVGDLQQGGNSIEKSLEYWLDVNYLSMTEINTFDT